MKRKKIHPKLKDMTEEERKAWEKQLNNLEGNNLNRDGINKISQGRGWIF